MRAVMEASYSLKAHHHSVQLMGCHFVITAVDESPDRAWTAIRAAENEIIRIEELISSWKDSSETSEINRMAGVRPVKVSKELFSLIERSLKVSHLTSGAFDISGTLSRYYWNFNNGKGSFLPEAEIIELRDLMDYRLIQLDRTTTSVFLRKEGMKIGFGGIGKGYAAYQAHKVMQDLGIRSGLINASGDLMCWGSPPNDNAWPISIPDPEQYDRSLLQLSIPYGSVVSSGSQFNYTMIEGKRYSHIIDPRTGLPIEGLKSVSVVCPNPEFGDAFATAISVLGSDEGLSLINRINGVECVIVDRDGQTLFSDQLKESSLQL